MIKKRILYSIILSVAMLLTQACVKEIIDAKHNGKASLSFAIPTSRGSGDDPEFVMEKLRVIIFESTSLGVETGIPMLNKLYFPDAEVFVFNEVVPVGHLNIYIIANETDNLGDLSLISASSTLRAAMLNYTTTPGNNVLPPPNGLPSIPAVLMYSEYKAAKVDLDGVLTHHQAKIGSGGETVLLVDRTIAKITVHINCDFASMLGNTKISLTGARIVSMPYYPALLANQVYTGSASTDYFNSASLSLASYITSVLDPAPPNTDVIGFKTIPSGFTFYMPESVPGAPGASNRGRYTYLELTGVSVGTVPVLNLLYKVPLGDGLGITVGATEYTADYLLDNYATVPASVLTVSRNTHYNLTLNITGLGMREALEVIVTAKAWNPTIDLIKDIEYR